MILALEAAHARIKARSSRQGCTARWSGEGEAASGQTAVPRGNAVDPLKLADQPFSSVALQAAIVVELAIAWLAPAALDDPDYALAAQDAEQQK